MAELSKFIFLGNHAKKIGRNVVVDATPYFYPITQEMVMKYFETISDAIELPIIL